MKNTISAGAVSAARARFIAAPESAKKAGNGSLRPHHYYTR